MNHTHKTIFNRALGVWQAVAETARARGKAKTRQQALPPPAITRPACSFLSDFSLGAAALLAGLTAALPAAAQQNLTIDGGNASITFPVGTAIYGNGPNPVTPGANVNGEWLSSSSIDLLTPNGNTLKLINGASTSMFAAVYGSYVTDFVADITANNNTLTVDHSSVGNEIYGGFTYAGTGAATASGNTVNATNGAVISGAIVGGQATSLIGGSASAIAIASNNAVTVDGGASTESGNVTGGYATASSTSATAATANNNVVNINNGKLGTNAPTAGTVYGGYATGGGVATATGNQVTVQGNSEALNVYGGRARSNLADATASGNTVTIAGGIIKGDVYGGNASTSTVATTATANNNTINISGGIIQGGVIGGKASTPAGGTATVSNNTVNYSGGQINGDLIGTLMSGTVLIAAGNTLNVRNTNLTVGGDLSFFQNLNFYVPATAANGATMLTVGGTAYLGAATVNVGIAGAASPLQTGDKIVLIHAGTLNGAPANTTANGTGMQGVTLKYDFDIAAVGNDLIATLTHADAGSGAKSLLEGRIGGLGFLTQSQDLLTRKVMPFAPQGGDGVQGFALIDGGSERLNSGSHVDTAGVSFLAGAAWNHGPSTLGAFIEAGRGNYDSYNSFSNAPAVKGSGNTDYYGVGVMGRQAFAVTDRGEAYADASLRIGRASTDFSSHDLVDMYGQGARYDTASAYYGAHVGGGYRWQFDARTSLDLSARYLWTRMGSDSLHLNTGDPIEFNRTDSSRARVGGRLAWAASETLTPYVGAYYEHEFDGKAKGTAYGLAIDSPSIKGDTGIAEIGFSLQPTKSSPLWLEVGIQGYGGKREGVTGGVQARYTF